MINRIAFVSLFLFVCFAASAQVPINIGIQILKVEDGRRYNNWLEDAMRSPNADVRKRAALAAGRIGKEQAIPALIRLLENDPSADVRIMAAFALGEVESINAADAILAALGRSGASAPQAEMRAAASAPALTARLLEAAGKIAAANPKDEKSKQLGEAVVSVLKAERQKMAMDTEVLRLGLTATLRARPAGAEDTVRTFLAYTDPAVVADALNTLARLRGKNASRDALDLLATSPNAVVRANAARVLGTAEDKEAVDLLIKAATSDGDSRVRVSAIRSLASLKDMRAAGPLVERVYKLMADNNRSRSQKLSEKNELLELATTLGRLKQGSHDEKVFSLLANFARVDKYVSPETEIALMRIDPEKYLIYSGLKAPELKHTWQALSSSSQAMAVLGEMPETADNKPVKAKSVSYAREALDKIAALPVKDQPLKAMPDLIRAYAAFKPDDLEATLREFLTNDDVFIRATAAELLAENAPSTGVRLQIENAFKKALTTDKKYDDAQLAMLDAMAKINKAASVDTLYAALDAPDYLVRKKALDLLNDPALIEKNPYVNSVLTLARQKHKDEVWPFDPNTGTKLGQVLNTDADYRRALSRKNGNVKAVVTTEKGAFTIDLLPEEAPLTVDNFIKLARANYFNGLEVHRVVPNFVMQDGDPRGDGNGGPGWSIRCEINMVPYERGAVGMALSGKDTGGSQWFVTHSPQPHLDGGYTVFGRVNETGMRVVDNIVRGDRILSIRIVESGIRRRN